MKIAAMALACLVLSATAFAHGNAVPQPPVGETAVVADAARVVDAFHDALAKGDRGAAQALLDENVQIYEQGWVERSRAEYAAHHLDSDIAFSTATTLSRAARSGAVLGDLAYVSSEGKIAGTFKGKAIDSITLETMVLRREGSGWRIVHIHWSSRDAKK